MAKNKFLTTNYGYNNSSNRYAFKIDSLETRSTKINDRDVYNIVDSITIDTGNLTDIFLNQIKRYEDGKITIAEATGYTYDCNIRTTNSLYSEPRLLEIIEEAEGKLKIVFWAVIKDKESGQYIFSKSPLTHPSASMLHNGEKDNPDSGKIHNVFFLDNFHLLGNVEIGCYSVNIGYENIGGQVSTFSNGQSNMPLGDFSSAFGWKNKTGYACSAFGFENKILGQESSGFGAKITIANGAQRSAGFGASHTIKANYGMAFGLSHQITEDGVCGTAFGSTNAVRDKCGLAGGYDCSSNSENSFSFGEGLRTWGRNVAVFGQYNAYNSSGKKDYLFAIGNGVDKNNRKNALELDTYSNLKIEGGLIAKGDLTTEGDLITKDGKLSENYATKKEMEDSLTSLSNSLEDPDVLENLKEFVEFSDNIDSILSSKLSKEELKCYDEYGLTDIYTLTEDDIWISEDGTFEAQKHEKIEYDVVIIPPYVNYKSNGEPNFITKIEPKTPEYNADTGEWYYGEGIHSIYINAKKIICPNTLVNVQASLQGGSSEFSDIKILGDFVLNEGIQNINLEGANANTATEIGNITIPTTLKLFRVYEYHSDIAIPYNVEKFRFYCARPLECNLYVYNPYFDFSDFSINLAGDSTSNGLIHGYVGSTAEAYAREHGYPFIKIESDNNKEPNLIANLEKYGATDVYVLQEGVDFEASNGVMTKLLNWNFEGQIVAIPDGVTEVQTLSMTSDGGGYMYPFTCKELIFPDSLEKFNIGEIAIDNLITNNVKEIFLSGDPFGTQGAAHLPSRILFGKNIEKIGLFYPMGAYIGFAEYIQTPITITGEVYGGYGDYVTINLDNVEDYLLNIYDADAEGNLDIGATSAIHIYGYAGSKAERYAKLHNMPFTNIGSNRTPLLYSSTATEATISANEYYTFTDIESLTVTLDAASTTNLDEFMFSFITPDNADNSFLQIISDKEIKWIKEPNLKPNYIYEVSIVNNVGVIAGTAKEVA